MVLVLLTIACGKSATDPSPGGKAGSGGIPGTLTGGFSLRVASYNVLKPSGRREEMSLDNFDARFALASAIKETKAQIIAFNELDSSFIPGGEFSISGLCTGMPAGWTWRLQWPNDIIAGGRVTYSYANGYAYDSTVLREEGRGYVWLDKTDMYSYADPVDAYQKVGSPERTCIYVRFTHIQTNTTFWFFVTHLPTSGQGGAENMAAVVNRFASQTGGPFPQILCGDMNSGPGSNSAPYDKLKSYWKDAYETIDSYGGLGSFATYSGTLSGSSTKYYYDVKTYTKNHPERRIDHIMTHGVCAATTYETVWTTYKVNGEAWCPSDHLPVVATIEF